jgi:hypothetical protein
MPLVVEDGTMPAGANAYAGVEFADGWLGDRGHADWPQGPGEGKEAALIKAADYLNGLRWYGRKAKAGEPRAMAWPRVGARDADGDDIPEGLVPFAVKAANAYLARLALIGTDLQPVLERGGRIQSEKVGTLATSYFEDSPSRDIYCGLADLLRGLAEDFEDYAGGATGSKGFSIMATTT